MAKETGQYVVLDEQKLKESILFPNGADMMNGVAPKTMEDAEEWTKGKTGVFVIALLKDEISNTEGTHIKTSKRRINMRIDEQLIPDQTEALEVVPQENSK